VDKREQASQGRKHRCAKETKHARTRDKFATNCPQLTCQINTNLQKKE